MSLQLSYRLAMLCKCQGVYSDPYAVKDLTINLHMLPMQDLLLSTDPGRYEIKTEYINFSNPNIFLYPF